MINKVAVTCHTNLSAARTEYHSECNTPSELGQPRSHAPPVVLSSRLIVGSHQSDCGYYHAHLLRRSKVFLPLHRYEARALCRGSVDWSVRSRERLRLLRQGGPYRARPLLKDRTNILGANPSRGSSSGKTAWADLPG